jgi:hypothetical protein
MRISYISPAKGTSLHCGRALERLGHEVHIIDPGSWLGASKWVARWRYHAGAVGVIFFINRQVKHDMLSI